MFWANANAGILNGETHLSVRPRDDLVSARSSRVTARLLYCDFGCVVEGAVLDGAALGFAFALACFFFFGAVSAPGVAGGALVSCWASTSDAVSTAAAGTASPVASPASKKYFSTRN
jgi:hypothetical protein